VSLGAEEGHVLLGVVNAGDGVPSAELEQIFEPFYRGAEAKQRRVRGAGLGLAICRGIVEAHGGRIWVENGHDRTTTFLLTLPLKVGEPV
jgi:signal transduction histidine kinase